MDELPKTDLRDDPGAAGFAAVAENLRLEGDHQEALIVLLKGLSSSPSSHPARLLLARVFFELECVPFALREIGHLCQVFPDNQSLKKLYRGMGGTLDESRPAAQGEVVAESEIDFDAIEDLDGERG